MSDQSGIVEEKNTVVIASLHDSRFPLSREAKLAALELNRSGGRPPRPTSADPPPA